MPYVLGIDIGNTSTVAAVAHLGDSGWGRPEPVTLGGRPFPSTLLLASDGTFIPGAVGDPNRTAHKVLSRVGDDVQMVIDGVTYPPQTLVALIAAHVVEQVCHAQDALPAVVVLSHPAGWGRHRCELLRYALWERGLGEAVLLPRTITVAESHAARGVAFDLAAVYALGGTSFEAALVRRNSWGRYETVGVPQALRDFGGTDFDEALADHVRAALARELAAAGAAAHTTLRALPAGCERAKQKLTVDPAADVELPLPTGAVRVPVTRLQFEELIRPAVRATVQLLLRAVHSAGLAPGQLDGVLLAGGSSRVPLVAELLATAGLHVMTAPDPQTSAAAGAAVAASQILTPRPLPAGPPISSGAVVPTSATPPAPPGGDLPYGEPPSDDPPPRPPILFAPLELPKPSRRKLARSRGRKG